MKRSLAPMLAIFLSAPLAVFAQTAPAPAPVKADPAKAQQIVTQVCAACHGADGNSVAPANPKISAQHAEYLAKQLRDFKAVNNQPPARKSAVMNGIAAPLTDEDIRNLSAYFAQQTPKPGTARDKELVAIGEKLYRGGNPATGVPACMACHAPNGAGIPTQFPRLAGQHADYTLAQLRLFRTGERANDGGKMMRVIAGKMSEQEMRAVADYIAGLR